MNQPYQASVLSLGVLQKMDEMQSVLDLKISILEFSKQCWPFWTTFFSLLFFYTFFLPHVLLLAVLLCSFSKLWRHLQSQPSTSSCWAPVCAGHGRGFVLGQAGSQLHDRVLPFLLAFSRLSWQHYRLPELLLLQDQEEAEAVASLPCVYPMITPAGHMQSCFQKLH